MDFWRSQFLAEVGFLLAFLAVSSITALYFARQYLNDPKKKSAQDKALLKELLEGFGLEIPSELKDTDPTVIKTIKTQ